VVRARGQGGTPWRAFPDGHSATDKKTFVLELKEPFGAVLDALGKPSSNVPFIMPALGEFCADLFGSPAYQPLDLTPEQIYDADAHRPNRDPSDALICAAARHVNLPLLSRDPDIRHSGLETPGSGPVVEGEVG